VSDGSLQAGNVAPRTLVREGRHPFDFLLVLAIGVVAIFPGLGQRMHYASHEILHAEIMREMAESGDFVETKFLGQPLVDKPPVIHAPGAALMRRWGEPSVWIARLPSAVAGLAGALATFALGLVLLGRRSAWIGAIGLLGIPGYAVLAREVLPDMALCASIVLSCFGLAVGMRSGGLRRGLLLAFAGAWSGLGVLAKGPYGLLFPVFFAILAPIGRDDMERPRLGWLAFACALLAVTAVWVVPVYLRDQGVYLHNAIFQPDLDVTQPVSDKPLLMYFWVGLAYSLPLSLFLPLALVDLRRRGYSAPLAMAAAILLVITLVPKKRDHYLLPLYPFLALGIADAMAARWESSPWIRRLTWTLIPSAVLALPVFFAVLEPLVAGGEDPEMRVARKILSVAGRDARFYVVNAHEEMLAWAARRSTGIVGLRIDGESLVPELRAAPPGAYVVISERRVAPLLQRTGPLPLKLVLEEKLYGDRRLLFRFAEAGPGATNSRSDEGLPSASPREEAPAGHPGETRPK